MLPRTVPLHEGLIVAAVDFQSAPLHCGRCERRGLAGCVPCTPPLLDAAEGVLHGQTLMHGCRGSRAHALENVKPHTYEPLKDVIEAWQQGVGGRCRCELYIGSHLAGQRVASLPWKQVASTWLSRTTTTGPLTSLPGLHRLILADSLTAPKGTQEDVGARNWPWHRLRSTRDWPTCSHLRMPLGEGLAGVRGAATGCGMEARSGCGLASASVTSSNLRCGVFSTTLLTCGRRKHPSSRSALGSAGLTMLTSAEISNGIRQPVCIIYTLRVHIVSFQARGSMQDMLMMKSKAAASKPSMWLPAAKLRPTTNSASAPWTRS